MKYVITGGPGVGKTTTLVEILNRGHLVIPEAARSVIMEGVHPAADLVRFQSLVLARQRDNEARVSGVAFCDRGVFDGVAYCRVGGVLFPENVGAHRYAGVFLLDRLPNYVNDSVRFEDSVKANALHEAIGDVYREFGFDVVSVPVLPASERAQFILDRVRRV